MGPRAKESLARTFSEMKIRLGTWKYIFVSGLTCHVIETGKNKFRMFSAREEPKRSFTEDEIPGARMRLKKFDNVQLVHEVSVTKGKE